MAGGEFSDRIALITGGGRGFGKAFGHALAARGAYAILADIDADAGEQAAADIRAAGGGASSISCDVADESAVAALMREVSSCHGGIDILINNAGLHSEEYATKSISELGLEKSQRLFAVNVTGVMLCSLAAHPLMAHRDGAAIVNISSSASYVPFAAYGVSKLAVRGLTACFAHDFAKDGIRVNGIAPGLIFTDTIRTELSRERADRVKAMQILPQDGEEADIVEAMLYLVSSRSKFVTGETLRVSGGFALYV